MHDFSIKIMQCNFTLIINMSKNKKPDNYQILKRNKSDESLYTLPVYLEDISLRYCCATNYLKTQWLEIISIDNLLASLWVSLWRQLDYSDVYGQLWVRWAALPSWRGSLTVCTLAGCRLLCNIYS